MWEKNRIWSHWEDISHIVSSNPTNVSESGEGEREGEALKWHVHFREINTLKIHQAPNSCNSKLRPLDLISRLNPSPKSGSNIIINHKKVKEFQQGISNRYAFYVILFLDMLWPVIPAVFTLPRPFSYGQLSFCFGVYLLCAHIRARR